MVMRDWRQSCSMSTRTARSRDSRLSGRMQQSCSSALPTTFLHGSPITRQDQVQICEELSGGGDPSYADGSGTNVVRYEIFLTAFTTRNITVTATLYYQSIPPYFLNDRFTQAPSGPATQRLYYLTSNLQTKGTSIEDWKFRIATASEVATLR